jgi:hypothetical protein
VLAVLRPSDVVAVGVSEMLIPIGQLLKPIGKVALRELPPGVLKIILRQGEVQSGTARVAVVAMAPMTVVVVVVVAEQSLSEI